MIKAIIWDMDGVIIDSETHYQRLEKEFLGRLGIFADTSTNTTKKLADQVLLKFDLLKYFSERTHGDEIKNGKPDPEIFNLSMEKLNLSKDEVVIIEDSVNGMKAGHASGAKVIAYKGNHNKDLDFSLADYVVTDLREIHRIVETLK